MREHYRCLNCFVLVLIIQYINIYRITCSWFQPLVCTSFVLFLLRDFYAMQNTLVHCFFLYCFWLQFNSIQSLFQYHKNRPKILTYKSHKYQCKYVTYMVMFQVYLAFCHLLNIMFVCSVHFCGYLYIFFFFFFFFLWYWNKDWIELKPRNKTRRNNCTKVFCIA